MKDVIWNYKKNKKLNNLFIVLASLVLALSINFLVFDWNSLTNSLKTNVLESNEAKTKADLYLENNNWNIVLNASKKLNNVTNLSLSLVYNPENVELKDFISSLNSNINHFSNTPWITTIIIDFNSAKTFNSWEEVLKIWINKKENLSEQLNIINANFSDIDNQTYLPTTSWITF